VWSCFYLGCLILTWFAPANVVAATLEIIESFKERRKRRCGERWSITSRGIAELIRSALVGAGFCTGVAYCVRRRFKVVRDRLLGVDNERSPDKEYAWHHMTILRSRDIRVMECSAIAIFLTLQTSLRLPIASSNRMASMAFCRLPEHRR